MGLPGAINGFVQPLSHTWWTQSADGKRKLWDPDRKARDNDIHILSVTGKEQKPVRTRHIIREKMQVFLSLMEKNKYHQAPGVVL